MDAIKPTNDFVDIRYQQSGKSMNTSDTIPILNVGIYHLYNLTYDEVLIIDPETPISRGEYETYKPE